MFTLFSHNQQNKGRAHLPGRTRCESTLGLHLQLSGWSISGTVLCVCVCARAMTQGELSQVAVARPDLSFPRHAAEFR